MSWFSRFFRSTDPKGSLASSSSSNSESAFDDPADSGDLPPSVAAALAAQAQTQARAAALAAARSPRPPWRFLSGLFVVTLMLVFVVRPLLFSSPPPVLPPGFSTPDTTPSGSLLRLPGVDVPEMWQWALALDSSPLSSDELQRLLSDSESSLLPEDQFAQANDVASRVLKARVTNVGRQEFSSFFQTGAVELPMVAPPQFCADVSVKAANAQPVLFEDGTVSEFVQVLVLFSGSCPRSDAKEFSSVVSLKKEGSSFVPVWSLAEASRPQGVPVGIPQDWELGHFSQCGAATNEKFQARVEVVAAFEKLCRSAEKDGVELKVTSALRSPQEQEALYNKALDKLDSPAAATRRVAFSDGELCQSRHCAGEALDVDLTGPTKAWLFETVGCLTDKGFAPNSSCEDSSMEVSRLTRFGFTTPILAQSQHLELALPLPLLDVDTPGSCSPPLSQSPPQIIVSVFRCRLMSAGLPPDVVDQAAGEAVVISQCASGWNPSFVAFSGRYRSTPNPSDGLLYDQAGLFAFSSALADRVVPGGYNAVLSPVAAADGAALLWLTDYQSQSSGFASFSCADGTVPSLGGPSLPSWTVLLTSRTLAD